MLAHKGISITDLELMVLIESALCEFNDAFNKASWKEGIERVTSNWENNICRRNEVPEAGLCFLLLNSREMEARGK